MLYKVFSGVTATPCWAKSHLHILNRNMTSTKRTHSWTLVLWCWSTIPFATFMCLGQWAPSPLVNFVRFSRSTSVVRFFMFGFSLSSFFKRKLCIPARMLRNFINWSAHFWILLVVGLCLFGTWDQRLTSLGLYLSDCQGLNSGTETVHVNTLYILYIMQNGSTFWYSERFAQIKVCFWCVQRVDPDICSLPTFLAPAWAVFPELSACFCYSCHYLDLRAFFPSNEFIVRHLYCHKLSVQMSCTTSMKTERRIKTHYCLSSFMDRRPFARYFCWGCCWQSCGNCWISTLGPARKVVSPGEILMLSCCSLWRLVGIWCLGRGFSKDEMFGSGVVGLGKIQADKYILNHIIE